MRVIVVALRRVALAMIVAGLLGVIAYPIVFDADSAAATPQIMRIAWVLLGVGLAMMVIVARLGRGRGDAAEEREQPSGRKDTSNIGRRVPLDRTEPAPEQPERRWGRGDPE